MQKKLIGFAFLTISILFAFLFYQSQGIEGGQDSWQHYLISRFAIKYPDLLLDQWNKPVFTWFTVLICQADMKFMILFNIVCVLLSGLLISLALAKKNIENAYLALPFLCFVPILFGNTISCLTEPLNVLLLSAVFYLWLCDHLRWAVILASFLPFVRTEGFVICGALFFILLYKQHYKLILWLLIGSIVLNLAGFAITNKPLWIITENPYLKFEQEGQFDPGTGSLLYYVKQIRNLLGLPLLILFAIGNVLTILSFWNKSLRSKLLESGTILLVFWFYFTAHTLIYYLGILGSHGLVRVMAVIAPCIAIISIYSFNIILEQIPSFRFKHIILPLLIAIAVIHVGYKENHYAKPYHLNQASVHRDVTLTNFEIASQWLQKQQLMNRTIIHQLPAFNVLMNKDPYDPKSSYYIWSINKQDDWAEKGVIVVWDGFYSTREGNMPLDWLSNNVNYKLIYGIEGYERPENYPTMYDIRIFEKIN